MLDFAKIILPIDLKEPSLARHFHSEIVIVHMVERPADINTGDPENKTILSARLIKAQKRLDASLHDELGGISARRRVLEGKPAQAIAQSAIEERANLVVMGMHGVSGLPYSLMGSVATKL